MINLKMTRAWMSFVLAIGYGGGLGFAQAPTLLDQLTPNNPTGTDGFGWSVGVSGDFVVVGAPYDEEASPGGQSGAAYVFRKVGADWMQETKLIGSQVGFQDTFGWSVAIDGDRIAVGAPHKDIAGGALAKAYVFRRVGATWIEEAILLSSSPAPENVFGSDVAIDGDRIVVGDPDKTLVAVGRASVFVWNGASWEEEGVLMANGVVIGDQFGSSVAIDADRVVVGALGSQDRCPSDPGCGSGAYVFRNLEGSWIEETRLMTTDPGNDGFGRDVSISGKLAAVGAPGNSGGGAVYVFELHDGLWQQQAKITTSDRSFGDGFGNALAIENGLILATAPGDQNPGEPQGSAYIFRCVSGNWLQTYKILPEGPATIFQSLSIDVNGSVGALPTYPVPLYSVPIVPPCIPALSSWGMLVMALFVTIIGTTALKRRKGLALVLFAFVFSSGRT